MNHKFYIKRCLQLAKKAIGTTRPNPSVGAVIVHKNKIIAEGFTSSYGGNHAEVNAINLVKNKQLLKDATIYVTLEPCSHFGKTPPCADLIAKHQIKNVVIGCVDTNSLVSGKGIEKLKNAGCNVEVGILKNECLLHHKRFFTVENKKRPYIILKWAQTQDGFIAPETKNEQKPVWISNQYSQQLVHKWRSKEHAILVGTNTVLADNPKLNVRSWSGAHPIRIVLDAALKLDKKSKVFDGTCETIVITSHKSFESKFGNKKGSKNQLKLKYGLIDFTKNVANQICEVLQQFKVQSVIVEGGTKTLQTFIDDGLWDEARIFSGNSNFKKGIIAPSFSHQISLEKKIQNNTLRIYYND